MSSYQHLYHLFFILTEFLYIVIWNIKEVNVKVNATTETHLYLAQCWRKIVMYVLPACDCLQIVGVVLWTVQSKGRILEQGEEVNEKKTCYCGSYRYYCHCYCCYCEGGL